MKGRGMGAAIRRAVLLSSVLCVAAHGAETGARRIAIMVPVTQPVVEETIAGFKRGMESLGYREGIGVTYSLYDAAGDPNRFTPIVQAAVETTPDVLVPVSTPITQRLIYENVAGLPTVFIAVTDPVGASILQGGTLEKPGGWITGVADVFPYDAQLDLVRRLMPRVAKVGLVYNPSEENSQFAIKQLAEYAKHRPIEYVNVTVATPGELTAAANSLVGKVDCIYLFPDNTVAGNVGAVLTVARSAGVPVFAGDSGMVKQGAVATVSIGYEGVGKLAAELVDKVLRGAKPGELSVRIARGDEYYLNVEAAREFGVDLPKDLVQRATQVYGAAAPAEPSRRLPWQAGAALVAVAAILILLWWVLRRPSTRE